MTRAEIKEHLTKGTDVCMVCGRKLLGEWTDYNGQIRCVDCGATHQVLGCHLTREYLQEFDLEKKDIARTYFDQPESLEIQRDYWKETSKRLPFGWFMETPPNLRKYHNDFIAWLLPRANEYKKQYPDAFDWEAVEGLRKS
ncbi:hypothetical protein M0R72_10960 [Candidatus Pacearchaeota archaeon]|jgi:hypothetical protein|nr:hypothetical protein [Candidatus Pacearchaeota archaeon]